VKASEDRLWCVVPAAGRGARYASELPKQYLQIAGKSVLRWTLERLALHPRIAGLVLVLSAEDVHWTGDMQIHDKPVLKVIGGNQRSDSVLAGLLALSANVDEQSFVLVHDAARPCVLAADIDALIEQGTAAGGALLAAPVRDTLKRADADRRVLATESRESRWRALTPQMFRLGELIAALESAREKGLMVSDEAMAMEHAGFRPLLVEGRADNLKLTTPADKGAIEYFLLHGDGRR
jgi:2-C-methyl-D-erythritol 4-phosphate cytidylyltransferase